MNLKEFGSKPRPLPNWSNDPAFEESREKTVKFVGIPAEIPAENLPTFERYCCTNQWMFLLFIKKKVWSVSSM
jgi:hypothetical protein